MLIGAQVSSASWLEKALARGRELDADVIQIFTQSPRMWRSPSHPPEQLAAYKLAQAFEDKVQATFCHATYLINLASPTKELAELSSRALVENLVAATAIGASGVILHAGSHRGAGFADSVDLVAERLVESLDEATRKSNAATVCPLLLENTAGAGGTIGRSFEELASLLSAASNDKRLGVCIDTQHLFASGIRLSKQDRGGRGRLEVRRRARSRAAVLHPPQRLEGSTRCEPRPARESRRRRDRRDRPRLANQSSAAR